MTEDDKEERSFRSLLPSEAHRRETKDKSHHQDESDDGACGHSMALVPRTHNILKVTGKCFQTFASINSIVSNCQSLTDFPASRCLHMNPFFVLFLPAIVGCKYGIFWWSKQLFTVHYGHGASVHEGWAGETPSPEFLAASSPESAGGENQNWACLVRAPEKKTERQRRGWQNASYQKEAEGAFDETSAGAGAYWHEKFMTLWHLYKWTALSHYILVLRLR